MTQMVFVRFEYWLSFLLIIPLYCPSLAHANSESLCSSEEEVLFSCSIGKKLVSVCSSKDLSLTSGYVQYRFGARGHDLEFVYPLEKAHPATKFSYANAGGTPHSGLLNLFFMQSGFSYTIYAQTDTHGTSASGVRVTMPDSKTIHLKCKEEYPINALYKLRDLGLRELPAESIVSLTKDATLSAGSPNADLLQGLRKHDFALVTLALEKRADVNFPLSEGRTALGVVADGRTRASLDKRNMTEFDEETDRLVTLLLERGAAPKKIDIFWVETSLLNDGGSLRPVYTLLDAGFRNDYNFRLTIGALIGDPVLVKDSLDHGADPNERGVLTFAISLAYQRSDSYSGGYIDKELEQALSSLEYILKAGAKVDVERDFVNKYEGFGQGRNIQPILELLHRYSTSDARNKSLY